MIRLERNSHRKASEPMTRVEMNLVWKLKTEALTTLLHSLLQIHTTPEQDVQYSGAENACIKQMNML